MVGGCQQRPMVGLDQPDNGPVARADEVQRAVEHRQPALAGQTLGQLSLGHPHPRLQVLQRRIRLQRGDRRRVPAIAVDLRQRDRHAAAEDHEPARLDRPEHSRAPRRAEDRPAGVCAHCPAHQRAGLRLAVEQPLPPPDPVDERCRAQDSHGAGATRIPSATSANCASPSA